MEFGHEMETRIVVADVVNDEVHHKPQSQMYRLSMQYIAVAEDLNFSS